MGSQASYLVTFERAREWAEREQGREYAITSHGAASHAFRRSGLEARKVYATTWWLLYRGDEEVGAAHLDGNLTIYGACDFHARLPKTGRRVYVSVDPAIWKAAIAATGHEGLTPVEWVRELARNQKGQARRRSRHDEAGASSHRRAATRP
jgi:hypothetical protein